MLKVGASLGILAGTGIYGGYRLLPPGRSRKLESVDALDFFDANADKSILPPNLKSSKPDVGLL